MTKANGDGAGSRETKRGKRKASRPAPKTAVLRRIDGYAIEMVTTIQGCDDTWEAGPEVVTQEIIDRVAEFAGPNPTAEVESLSVTCAIFEYDLRIRQVMARPFEVDAILQKHLDKSTKRYLSAIRMLTQAKGLDKPPIRFKMTTHEVPGREPEKEAMMHWDGDWPFKIAGRAVSCGHA